LETAGPAVTNDAAITVINPNLFLWLDDDGENFLWFTITDTAITQITAAYKYTPQTGITRPELETLNANTVLMLDPDATADVVRAFSWQMLPVRSHWFEAY
jgi:hypothetical protein